MELERKYGLTIKYIQDEYAENPREDMDNLCEMICFHSRYKLGDKHVYRLEQLEEMVKSKDYLSLPLFLYDHSGITMKTAPFPCLWDSGQVGYIIVSKEKIRKEYSVKRVTNKVREKVYDLMRAEVSEYDGFISGQVYGYVIEDEDGNSLDSCWGYLCGNKEGEEYLRNEARNAAKRCAEELSEKKAKEFLTDNEPELLQA